MNNFKVNNFKQEGNMLFADISFAPVQPVPYINMTATFNYDKTWQDTLQSFYHHRLGPSDYEQAITEKMQELYPGPYVVEEFYNAKLQRFDVHLKFNSEQEELMWKIKNS